MSAEKMIKYLLLKITVVGYDTDSNYKEYIDNKFNIDKMREDLDSLNEEFLNEYALNNTSKED